MAAKKTAKKAAKADKSAPKVKILYFEKMNTKEVTTIKSMNGNGKGSRTPLELGEITERNGWLKSMGSKKGNWTVRNAIRRLLRCGWIERYGEKGEGAYRITQFGRSQMKKPTPAPVKASSKKVAKKPAKKPAKKVSAKKPAKAVKTVAAPTPVEMKPPSNVFVPPNGHTRAQA